jgi:hypothetical protein
MPAFTEAALGVGVNGVFPFLLPSLYKPSSALVLTQNLSQHIVHACLLFLTTLSDFALDDFTLLTTADSPAAVCGASGSKIYRTVSP